MSCSCKNSIIKRKRSADPNDVVAINEYKWDQNSQFDINSSIFGDYDFDTYIAPYIKQPSEQAIITSDTTPNIINDPIQIPIPISSGIQDQINANYVNEIRQEANSAMQVPQQQNILGTISSIIVILLLVYIVYKLFFK